MAKSTVPPHNISLNEISQVCNFLGSLTGSVLDKNSLALIIGGTGEVTFTRSGWRILMESSCSHPLAKIITNSIAKYYNETGNDSKMFLFLLKEIVNDIQNVLKGSNERLLRKQLSNEIFSLISVLPCIFASIRRMPIIHLSDPVLNSKSFTKDLEGIVATFMQSKFSHSVANELGNLIITFILESVKSWKSVMNSLDYFIQHFDIFCLKLLGPITDSYIKKGYIFNQKLSQPVSHLNSLKFIFIWDVSLSSSTNEISWKIENNISPNKLSIFNEIYKTLINILRSVNIKVLLTPSTACNEFKSLCLQSDIILIDRLAEEDVKHVLTCVGISPLTYINETLEMKNIGELNSISNLSYRSHQFIHMEFSPKFEQFNHHHLLLCAPFEALWKEYYSECLNCLKVIKQWFSKISYLCDGQDLSVVDSKLLTDNQLMYDHIEKNCICQKLSNFNPEFYSKIEPLFCYNDGTILNSYPLATAVPIGLWELLFEVALKQISDSVHPFYNIMHCVMSKIVCKNFNINCVCLKNLDAFLLDFFENLKIKNEQPLEPIASKETLIYSVLELIVQLLKIDAIVSIK